MALLLANSTIKEINGPLGMYCLESKDDDTVKFPLPYFIFFSDLHDTRYYKPCSTPNCYEIDKDFLSVLDCFAKSVRTDFYVEDFFSTVDIDKEHAFAKKIKNRDQKSKRSNMINLAKTMYECFIQRFKEEHCPYKNIYWQYSDVRKTFSNYRNTHAPNQFEHYIEVAKEFLDVLRDCKKNGFNKDAIKYLLNDLFQMRRKSGVDIVNFDGLVQYLQLIFTDIDEYTNQLFMSRTIKKQYDKLSPSKKRVFSLKSFQEHFEHWYKLYESFYKKQYNIRNTREIYLKFLHLISLMIRDKEVERPDEMIAAFDEITANEINYVNIFTLAVGSISVDMYFILRSSKPTVNQNLVIGYFGESHVRSIVHYYVNVLKTHKINYKKTLINDQYEFRGEEDPAKVPFITRKIQIKKKIDLNQKLGYNGAPCGNELVLYRQSRTRIRSNSKEGNMKGTKEGSNKSNSGTRKRSISNKEK
jgi:hypothetical protein